VILHVPLKSHRHGNAAVATDDHLILAAVHFEDICAVLRWDHLEYEAIRLFRKQPFHQALCGNL